MVNEDLKRVSQFGEPHDDVTVAPGLAQNPTIHPAQTGDFHC
jgi:hypothetical protein